MVSTAKGWFTRLLPSFGREQWLTLAAAALLLPTALWLRYGQIPGSFYLLRDDGVITFSHARNLVEYGAIGVDPSGARVEGFSSPLHFGIYLVAYGLFGIGAAA
ncbi:MAG: hypothetical protein JRI23_17150, partial [Deltaproteobacteria bacterium]|nr:hypothetical protein [Deltaproteobacteria bacterium]MBW2533542.1 hypothetical protein [Deltaproteobacteria bacterium]